ncbi:O-antigen ligase family protein [Fluviicola taffensis]|uniref:O-antigen ligase-related domain-containing protein n=1 Tax=Fluviicola taffensis (strain DSM 16823 / NCIMB 13979 / RW262) TaxID=755732 RepID=F2IDM9_FLUTR|nr:O-antigen ligase family protein [Fluviicola taffensis]AEA43402.1 hypothetical protein Fluta_1408 [Fluviicola taffensis DSM 16823]
MLDKLTGKPVHYYIQLIAMMGIAAGLPFSKIPLSIGTMLLGLNVILLWDWKNVLKSWFSNKWLWLLLGYLVLEAISFFWSENKHEAWDMLRREIPLYAIPLCIVAIPLKSFNHYKWVAIAFLSAVFLFSFINIGTYFHWWGNKVYDDIRSLSLFISHLRFAMMIVLSIVFCAAWWIRKFPYRWISLLLAAWFLFYINVSQIGMGFLTLSGVVFTMFYFKVKSIQLIWLKRVFILSFGGLVLFVCVFLYVKLQPIAHKIELNSEDYGSRTPNGNLYGFDAPKNMNWENGYPVYYFVSDEELDSEWSKVSKINYRDGTDSKGNPIRNILWRYMTSKGLRKDSVDFQKMTKEDIRNVERGFASLEMAKGGISAQLYRMRGQLNDSEDPNGKSLLEKVESLKAGLTIIKEHPICGVGVGDLEKSFQGAYQKNQTKLTIENQHLTHNQYFTTWISAGIGCFIVFISLWFIQFATALKINAFEWTGFLVITMLSFLVEDTLQTQTGIAFVGFFFAFFITGKSLLYPPSRKN